MIEIVGGECYQWDSGRYVQVTDTNASHVHFANAGDINATVMFLSESTVKVPDYLFQTGKQLCVYAVNNGVTVEKKIFPVRKRERPEYYSYDEDERNFIYEVIQAAEDATAEAERVAKELLAAKENGEFDGPQGPQGEKGNTGPQGPQGPQGEKGDTPTLTEIGAAPAGYVDAFYTVSDFVELLTKVDIVLPATISRKEVRLAMSVTNWTDNIPSGEYLITVYNEAPGYALLTAKSNVAQFQNRLYNGVWGEWVDCSPSAFAPAGYGLGSNATYIDDNKELKDVTLTGFYFWSDVSTASDKPFSAGDLLVIKRTDYIIDQIAFGHDTVDHQIRIRKIINGEETEWEWVNPPMATGVEYRTAERFDGSPVYTKLVYFGNLPNNGAGSVAWSPDSGYAGFIIDARVIAGGNFINLEHSANSSALWIVTNADYSDTTAAVLLKYTKA